MVHLLLFLFLWSLLALKAKCFTNHDALPCFVSKGYRYNTRVDIGRRRSSIALLPIGREGETMAGGTVPPNAFDNRASKRIRENCRTLSGSKIDGGGDNRHGNANARHLDMLKTKEARLVEKLLRDAVVRMSRSKEQGHRGVGIPPSESFPSVRRCNAALATLGDAGEFRRALRLFAQMKKSASLHDKIASARARGRPPSGGGGNDDDPSTADPPPPPPALRSVDLVPDPPKPTLVTYSTLMSRAVSLGKPRVALRLWNLMRNQPNFYLNVASAKRRDDRTPDDGKGRASAEPRAPEGEGDDAVIVPDVIFCNTLMNAHAKLGDHVAARSILDAMLGADGGGSSAAPLHEGIPPLRPTAVTYNTLADACQRGGELGAALGVPGLMADRAAASGDAGLLPDARTYTILISTVARKSANDVGSGGERDPDMAFALLNRMIDEGITPNGVTYCALIDVCSRCRRVDLALNGLRIMLKQKSKASLAGRQQALFNEVGAWTAAINACGKMERVDTAMRLFRTMQTFGVRPNSVTCGCLSDCLLKATPIRMTETFEVLQYMKQEGLVPGEVMYTSLMGIALTLAEKENRSLITKDGLQVNLIDKLDEQRNIVPLDAEDGTSEAICLYTELMRCLIQDGNDDMILKVFLLFQEMQNAGATPDVGCYNLLLRACASSGDVRKAQDVLWRMDANGVAPNRASWREALRAAKKAMRSDIADAIWDAAVTREKKDGAAFVPKASDVELLLSVYLHELKNTNDHEVRSLLNEKIMGLYEGITSRSEERGLRHESLSVDEIEGNRPFMLSVLRAAVSYELHGATEDGRGRARDVAVGIAALEIFQRKPSPRTDRASTKALQIAQNWLHSYSY